MKRLKLPEFDPETGAPNHNWTAISNRLTEQFFPNKVSGPLQMAIILQIARETWGASEKKTETQLSRSRAVKRWACSNQAFDTAIADLVARGIVIARRQNPKSPKATFYRCSDWSQPIPDYKRLGPVEIDTAKPNLQRAFQLVLFPGKRSRFVIRMGDREQAIECCNTLRQPAMLSGELAEDGTLIISAAEPERREKAKTTSNSGNWPSPLGQSSQDVVVAETKPPRQKPFRFQSPSPAAEIEPHVIEQYRGYLAPLVRDRWGYALDDDFLLSIIKRANGAPVAEYAEFIDRRLKRDSLKKLGKEILWHVAGDVATARAALDEANAADPWVSDGRGGWMRQSERPPEREQSEEETRAWLLSLSDEDYQLVIRDRPDLALPERAA